MLREVFKKQIIITSNQDEPLEFVTRLAIRYTDLKIDAIDELLNSQDTYEFQPKDKVFFLPGCTIPRFKTNNYFKSIDVGVSKTSAGANVIVVGPETGKSVLKRDVDYYSVHITNLQDYVEKKYPVGDPIGVQIRSLLESEDCYDYFMFKDYSVKQSWRDTLCKHTDTVHSWVTEEKRLKDIEDAILGGKIILNESYLLDKCNQTVMNDEMYEETRKMFDSDDTNNHVLAIELMANCNYQKSAVYLLMLMKEFRGEIQRRSESKHVNFESLCTFFDLNVGDYFHFDDMVKTLFEKNCITKADYTKLITLAKEEFGTGLNSDYFRYSDIEPTETFMDALEKAELKALNLSTQDATQAETQEPIISEEHE